MSLKEEIAIDLIIDVIHRLYGYDFKHYSKASFKRRIQFHQSQHQIPTIADFIPRLINDPTFFDTLLTSLSITVTEMFRDPAFYTQFRELVLPKLKTYSYANIWHAGCATGEEVYSMAILLHENHYLERTQIYATDFNPQALLTAQKGIYSDKEYDQIVKNYHQIKGKSNIDDYFVKKYHSLKIKSHLQKHISFQQHNLATDEKFADMQAIICRNVLIYFDETLKEKVIHLFSKSLQNYGFLCLGNKEVLNDPSFKCIDRNQSIYQKVPR